jgi:hypothetical protein
MDHEARTIRLWHVTVTVAGEALETAFVRASLDRLIQHQPFLHSMKYASDRAEIAYWEEADSLLDASSLALRIWDEHRALAGLPRWEVVGLEVLERRIYQSRSRDQQPMVDVRDVTPLPF